MTHTPDFAQEKAARAVRGALCVLNAPNSAPTPNKIKIHTFHQLFFRQSRPCAMVAPLSPVARTLSSALLYAPGAFFFYPWKPLMNALVGDSYGVAYAHFRRDHSDPLNLVRAPTTVI